MEIAREPTCTKTDMHKLDSGQINLADSIFSSKWLLFSNRKLRSKGGFCVIQSSMCQFCFGIMVTLRELDIIVFKCEGQNTLINLVSVTICVTVS